MRALFWIVGALASVAGGAYLVSRSANRRLSERFLAALREGPIVVEAYEPSIPASGFRAEAFRGKLAGMPFAFVGRTDVSGTKWTYALIWGDSRLLLSWNPLSGEAEHPLQQAYLILRRRASKDDGLSN
ncbi:MAG TPA: hypothetical protein VL283_03710 [Candidatus Baltobacteraceae bacterium]|nr:hypothetical protein [Candidatus Baltobacteraceae bacterium]